MVYCSNSMHIVIASHSVHIFCRLCCFPVVCELFWQASYMSFFISWRMVSNICNLKNANSIIDTW
jgi:hypothetical protein